MDIKPGKVGRGIDLRLLTLAFFAGILAVYRLPQLPPLWWAIPALVILALPWLPRDVRWYLTAAFAGVLYLTLYSHWLMMGRLDPALDYQDITVNGTIASLPQRGAGRTSFLFEPNGDDHIAFAHGDKNVPPAVRAGMARRIRVNWYQHDGPVLAGQCWRFTLRLKTPRGLSNPGAFDYEGWLFRSGIGAKAYVRAAVQCRHPARHPVLDLRQHIDRKIRHVLGHDDMRGIVLALTLGERGDIAKAQWRVFRRTGTSHLVAISGLHIGMVSAVVFLLIRWLWALWPGLAERFAAQRAAGLAAIGGAAVYALLAGFGLPTQRALVMVTAAMVALCLGRRPLSTRVLALALFAVLLINPLAVGSSGFWLSFAAVTWILYAVTRRLRRDGGWRTALWIQLVLTLALAPLTFYFFGRAPWASAPANIVLIPIFTVLVPILLFGVLLLGVWPWAGGWVIKGGAWALHLLWPAWSALAGASTGLLPGATPPILLVAMALAGLALVLAPRGLPGRVTGMVLCVPILVWHTGVPPPGAMRAAVLDVGQGLSMVVRTHAHALVFDTGPAYPGGFSAGRSVVVPYLRWAGVHQLDAMVISHGDLDHRGGAPAISQVFPVRRRLGWHGEPCRAGQHWRWDGVVFRFLHPDGDYWGDNNSSCVLKISAGHHALLLTGDIEAAAEAHLVKTERGRLSADVLVAPHHGSDTSSTAAFVRAVSPKFVIFPAGWDNQWYFPKPDVVSRYKRAGAVQLMTGRTGAILFTLRAGESPGDPVAWRKRHHRFWNYPAGR